jgi:hypothetical protein
MKTKSRRVKTRLKVLIAIAVLALIMLVLLFAPFFNISSIEVSGSTRYTPDIIKETAGTLIGENAFRKLRLKSEAILELRLLDTEAMIERLPYIKDCTVSIVFPNRIAIEVIERNPEAYLRSLDNFLTVDYDGHVLEVSHEIPGGGLKEIKGIEFSKYTLGGQLETSDISLIKTGVDVINAIKSSDDYSNFKLFEICDWVDIVDKNNVLLSLDGRIIVRFNPQDKLQYTIEFTKEIFFKKINAKETGRLEFSEDQNPSFIPE